MPIVGDITPFPRSGIRDCLRVEKGNGPQVGNRSCSLLVVVDVR